LDVSQQDAKQAQSKRRKTYWLGGVARWMLSASIPKTQWILSDNSPAAPRNSLYKEKKIEKIDEIHG